MSQITEYIIQINSLNYNKQCRYVKNKLLSLDTSDISRTLFFKKLHVILHNLPYYSEELDIKIDEKGQRWFTFWDELHDDSYIHDNNGVIRLKCIKLTSNIYQIRVPVKNTPIPKIPYIHIK